MTTVTGLTAERMIAAENATVVDGVIVGDDLHLVTRDGTPINAGNVRGPMGPAGSGLIICTHATRPTGLVIADEGLAIYETDTNLVYIWTGARWKVQERIICTSTTRPTTLVLADKGTKIYETDTEIEYTWLGSSWLIIPENALSRCLFSLWLTANQNFTVDGAAERVAFQSKDDPAGIATTGASAEITCPRDGNMSLTGSITIAATVASPPNYNAIGSIFTGTNPANEVFRIGGTAGGAIPPGCTFSFTGTNVFKVVAGQKFGLSGFMLAVGSTKTMLGGAKWTFFSGYYM